MADAFYGPRSRENARLLLDTAASLGYGPEVIRTQVGGYLIPEDVSDALAKDIQETAALNEQALREAEEQEAEKEKEQVEEQKVEEVARPAQADPKADWLAYAQHKGLDVTEDNTKAEIVEAVKKAEETD